MLMGKFKQFCSKWQLINNLKIRTKLIIIYVFCVIIPMLVTDTIIITNMSQSAKREQIADMTKQLEGLEYTLRDAIEGCVAVSKDLYADKILNKFLDTQYASNSAYYREYNRLLQNNVIRFYYTSQKIYDITIYSDNETMVNGGHFIRMASIREKDWYKAFQESDRDMISYIYYDTSKNYVPASSAARTVSVIRKLDYFDRSDRKIIKIDLDYNAIAKDIVATQFAGDVFVCNDSYILFSNQDSSVGHLPFEPVHALDAERAMLHREMTLLSQDWDLYVFADKLPLLPRIHQSMNLIVWLIGANLLLPTVVIILTNKSIRTRILLIGRYLNMVKKEQFEIIDGETGKDEIGELIHNYNRMVTRIKDLIEVVLKGKAEKQELEIAKKEAELMALQSQLNPHFMFNTLESIRMRCLIKQEEETAFIIGELATMMRKSLNWGSDEGTVEAELSFSENYLNLQKYRFGDKLSFRFFVMNECRKILIPKFSIVTFVENACVHGIEGQAKDGHLEVGVSTNGAHVFIEISDTGKGMGAQQLERLRQRIDQPDIDMLKSGKETGIVNAVLRLRTYFEGEVHIEIDSTLNKGTDVFIQIPLNKTNGEWLQEDEHSRDEEVVDLA